MEKSDVSMRLSGSKREQEIVIAIRRIKLGKLQSPEMTKKAFQQIRSDSMRRTIR